MPPAGARTPSSYRAPWKLRSPLLEGASAVPSTSADSEVVVPPEVVLLGMVGRQAREDR